jgi:hypothetical protein
LSAIISFAREFGGGFGFRRNEEFEAQTDLESLFCALTDAGYATRIGSLFCWTDNIDPMMRASYLRDDEGNFLPGRW